MKPLLYLMAFVVFGLAVGATGLYISWEATIATLAAGTFWKWAVGGLCGTTAFIVAALNMPSRVGFAVAHTALVAYLATLFWLVTGGATLFLAWSLLLFVFNCFLSLLFATGPHKADTFEGAATGSMETMYKVFRTFGN